MIVSDEESQAVFSERSPSSDVEDRDQTRYGVDFAVTVDSDHNFYAGYATNLSAGGFYIATHIVHPVGTEFNFTIQLGEDKQLVKGVGVVRWLRASEEGEETPAGLGIQFRDVEGDGLAKIDAFLKMRKPLRAPEE